MREGQNKVPPDLFITSSAMLVLKLLCLNKQCAHTNCTHVHVNIQV